MTQLTLRTPLDSCGYTCGPGTHEHLLLGFQITARVKPANPHKRCHVCSLSQWFLNLEKSDLEDFQPPGEKPSPKHLTFPWEYIVHMMYVEFTTFWERNCKIMLRSCAAFACNAIVQPLLKFQVRARPRVTLKGTPLHAYLERPRHHRISCLFINREEIFD
jgi:hypothetical protein